MIKVSTFQELIEELQSSENNPHYYKTLVNHSKIVMQEVDRRNQGVVAKDIRMNLTKFNALVPLLREYSYEQK